jgi:chaperone required for assembly of F1-ATPase
VEKTAEKPVEYVLCPWQLVCLRTKEMLCNALIAFHIGEGKCMGEQCLQYKCWSEVSKATPWKTEEQTNAVNPGTQNPA